MDAYQNQDITGKTDFLRYLHQTTWWWVPIGISSFLTFVSNDLSNNVWVLTFLFIVWMVIKARAWKAGRESYIDQPLMTYPFNLTILTVTFFIALFAAYLLVHAADTATYFSLMRKMAGESGINGSDRDVDAAVSVATGVVGSGRERLLRTPYGFFTCVFFLSLYWWRSYITISSIFIKGNPSPLHIGTFSRVAENHISPAAFVAQIEKLNKLAEAGILNAEELTDKKKKVIQLLAEKKPTKSTEDFLTALIPLIQSSGITTEELAQIKSLLPD